MFRKILTDKQKIDELLTRSIDTIYPTKDALRKELLSGRPCSVYVGIDPTADYVHLGHSTNFLLLEKFHELGHRVIVLVGDFTAMIGDPSDKTAARVHLSRKQILNNLKTFKQQIGKILNFQDKKNPIAFKFNSQWLSKLKLEQLGELAANFTVQQMLERDMFKKRIHENKPLYVHEFFYPLMQGYDSVALGVDIELGGTDQTFNMLAGRTLVKRYKNKEKFVITTTLLINSVTGEKLMSKSLGTGIGLHETSENMFGKTMALADAGIIQTFTDCTRLPLAYIADLEKSLRMGANPRNIKLKLAHEIVRMYHGAKLADQAREAFIAQFSHKQLPHGIAKKIVKAGHYLLVDLLKLVGLAASKTAAVRLLAQNGVRIGQVVPATNHLEIVKKHKILLQVGKRKFLYIMGD